MKRCAFLLLLGPLFLCCYGDFPPGSCDGYTNITEPWRNLLFKSSSFPGYPKNDSNLVGQWWRFTGIGGDKGQTKVEAFLGHITGQLKNNSDLVIPGATVINSLSASMAVSGVGPHATSVGLSSAGDGTTGNAILGITHNLVSIMYAPGQNTTQTTVSCETVDLSLKMVKSGSSNNEEKSVLSAKENTMHINMDALAKNNNGSAAVAFLTVTGMESLLSHEYFHTANLTEMYSDVITAILPSVNNTNLTEPVNFTIQHKKTAPESGMMTCVYWEEPDGGKPMGWSVRGCWVTFTNENYTVCSCNHLSTFALILQIAEPQPDESFLDWLNRMCVIVGLFFFALAILTFLLCSWNPKINNTARLHLCINLALSQLLLLWNSNYVDQKLACKVLAGLLHFLVVASFVWMLLEALQLHLLVRMLSKVQVIQRDGLPKLLLYLVGYGVPFVIVGVSALVYSDGYGATNGQCWLSTNRGFNWALTGPVVTVLGLNCALFGATLWSLRPTLASMKSDISQSKDTRLILFKILAQFVILGCTWILGLYQANLFFKVMFIILNSQQGTFLYIVHCLLNKEVREEYIKWLTCSFKPSEDHHNCEPDSCGPSAVCTPDGGCICDYGLEIPSGYLPTPASYGCVDIDECQVIEDICGNYATCTNIIGSYICTCLRGFTPTDATLPPGTSNPCINIDPCLGNICGNGTCYTNNPGYYECDCDVGFQLTYDLIPNCQDVDECQSTLAMCGPYSTCTNTYGSYICTCSSGFIAADPTLPPGSQNQCIENFCLENNCGNGLCYNKPRGYACSCNTGYYLTYYVIPFCQDTDECQMTLDFCGPYCSCTNTIGSYICICWTGFAAPNSTVQPGSLNQCTDIDECQTTLDLCGPSSICTNTIGSYECACFSGFTTMDSEIPPASSNPCTDIDECQATLFYCGPYSNCTNAIGSYTCTCWSGFTVTDSEIPPGSSNECTDINECETTLDICGPYSICTNAIGSYACTCLSGFAAPNSTVQPGSFNQCTDIDECQTIQDYCGLYSTCDNTIGSYTCTCWTGFSATYSLLPPGSSNPCIVTSLSSIVGASINSTLCGPNSICFNMSGAITCACQAGYTSTKANKEPSNSNICIDVDECVRDASICGPNSNCTNSIGSYFCGCLVGYRVSEPNALPSVSTPCEDINECLETPGICGKQTICTNTIGTYYCSCPDGFYPSTGVLWVRGVSYCQNLREFVDAITPAKTVANFFSACMEVSAMGSDSTGVSSEGDADTGSLILGIAEHLVSELLSSNGTPYTKTLQTASVDLSLLAIGPENVNDSSVSLSTKENSMEINLHAIASANDASAVVALLTLNGMENLLSHQYFQTVNKTEMYSDILTVVLPSVNNKILTMPVNFTIQHQTVPDSGMVTCVYWEDQAGQAKRWSVDGCWVAHSDENHTVCSCSHLSTFALIMQIGEAPPPNPFLEWLNRICAIIGLFFLALAILTFLLCSWNPKINNTARLHLCINLALSQLLMLWNSAYVNYTLACKAYAGLIHFFVIASFVWMLLEALQLHLLVRKLSKVQIIQRDGLPKLLLYLIGYGVPFVIVGISALVYSAGYGATDAQVCWLSTKRNFNWAITGPVIGILALNWVLFCATLWGLRPTLVSMRSNVSQSKDTRLIVFKILAQFVILGCPWILGLYQTNLFFQILFIILSSQQGTLLYIVHCLLNKEVREEYMRWLKCQFGKDKSVKDALSISEELDKPEEKTEERKTRND
ncbi:hypothetical protein Q5P01_017482 [Channa striata]|uniref:Uncharacterized protein n=1 Tax=Channa striata TaxID=64152 RepID=A0AA88M9P6_CHASR|nr:hypothetical protein Q5P01_017482 [Channa striata]